jgi:hypothetical protein
MSMMRGGSQSKGRIKNDTGRQQRLASELRANLVKRKEKARNAARAEHEAERPPQRSQG